MAENEVKTEKKHVTISIWFILFLALVIFSTAYIFSLNSKVATLEENLAAAELRAQQESVNALELKNTLKAELYELIDTYLEVAQEEEKEEVKNTVEVTTGTYTSVVSGEEATLAMTLTLAENNMATLLLTQESGDSTLNGTYTIADGSVVFTSEDGLTTYSFAAVAEGTLKIVSNGVELTLSK